MTLSTSEARRAWAPACSSKDGLWLDAYRALDACYRHWGYRVRRQDTGCYSCRRITGGTGYSLHAYGPGPQFTFWTGVTVATALACDTNWQTNPYGSVLRTDRPLEMDYAIQRIRTNNGKQVWRCGRFYSGNKDAMHTEIVCYPSDLRTGINLQTVPGGGSLPPPSQPHTEEFTVDAEARARFDAIERDLAAIKKGIMLDEASDDKVADSQWRQLGSLRGWTVAIARKLGVTREDAISADPTQGR